MKFLFLGIATLFANLLIAQPGELDSNFDGDGKKTSNLTDFKEDGNAVAIQPDGKILLGGTVQDNGFDAIITRFFPDGSIDNTFGIGGTVFFDFQGFNDVISCLIVLPDGKILAGGWAGTSADYDFVLVRYTDYGGLDNTFGVGGLATVDFGSNDFMNSMALLLDGKIVAVGETSTPQGTDCAIARFNYNGTLDNAFSFDGKATNVIEATADDAFSKVLIQADEKPVCIGYANGDVIISRYNTDGTLDQSFDGDGTGRYDVANQASDAGWGGALLTGGEILVCGTAFIQSDNDFALLKVNTTGAVVTGFGNNGVVLTNIQSGNDFAFSLTIQPDDKIIVGGCAGGDVALVRYTPNGSLDNSFGNNGKVVTDVVGPTVDDQIKGIVLQADGKLVGCGTSIPNVGNDFSSFLVRYFTGITIGIVEFNQTEKAPLLYPNPLQNTEHLKYTLGSDEKISIVLLDSQGKLVTTFVENENQPKGDHEAELNLPTNLPNGTYFIQIASEKGKVSIKTVK